MNKELFKRVLTFFYISMAFIVILFIYVYYRGENEFYLNKRSVTITTETKYDIPLTAKSIENLDYSNYEFSSSNEKIAKIFKDGTINTYKDEGKVTIYVKNKRTFEKKKLVLNVINSVIKSIQVKSSIIVLNEGEKKQLDVIVNSDKEVVYDTNFETDDPTIVDIDDNGMMKAIRKGIAEITISTKNGIELKVRVIVKKANEKNPIIEDNKDKEPIRAKSIKLNSNSLNIRIGTTAELYAIISPSNTASKKVIWTSSDKKVATVENGIVMGIKTGKVTITAETNNGKKATCTITVTKDEVKPSSITLDKKEITMYENTSTTVIPTIKPNNVTDNTIEWSTSDKSIATITKGKINALKPGIVTITVKTSNNKKASVKVKVEKKKEEATSISLSSENFALAVGGELKLTATVRPSTLKDKSVTWKSSDEKIATVDQTGKVKGIKAGKVTITAKTANGITAHAEVTVNSVIIELKTIRISSSDISIEKDSTKKLKIEKNPTNAEYESIKWTSSDSSIVSVTQEGEIKAVDYGAAYITATTDKDIKDTIVVTVIKAKLNNIKIDALKPIEEKSKTKLKIAFEPDGYIPESIEYKSENENIAKVNKDGVVIGINPGKTTITVTVDGISATTEVTITKKHSSSSKPYIKPITIALENYSFDLDRKSSKIVGITFEPANATERKLCFNQTGSGSVDIEFIDDFTKMKIYGKKTGDVNVTVSLCQDDQINGLMVITVKE